MVSIMTIALSPLMLIVAILLIYHTLVLHAALRRLSTSRDETNRHLAEMRQRSKRLNEESCSTLAKQRDELEEQKKRRDEHRQWQAETVRRQEEMLELKRESVALLKEIKERLGNSPANN